MKKLSERLLFFNISKEERNAFQKDVYEENRICAIIYSAIIAGGMSVMLILSYFVDVLASSRTSYEIAVSAGLLILIAVIGPAKKHRWLITLCQYILVSVLLAFGIILGTIVEPEQASASFAVLLLVTPLLFTDFPIKINTVNVAAIIIYTFIAYATQSSEMFSFNMSVILPYGIANLVLTHFTQKFKIERTLFAYKNKFMSEHDQLTGLANRRSFEKDIKALQSGEPEKIGVCSFDVNNLKGVNDSLGHSAGDALLIAAAGSIEKIFGKYGRCYRIGGDEFIAVIHGAYPDPDELIRVLNIEAKNHRCEYDFEVSISSGIAEGNNTEISSLLIKSDEIMYTNKAIFYTTEGRDRRKASLT